MKDIKVKKTVDHTQTLPIAVSPNPAVWRGKPQRWEIYQLEDSHSWTRNKTAAALQVSLFNEQCSISD